MKKLFGFMSIAIVLVLAMPGCNTVKGAGKDLEAVGDKGQRLIDRSLAKK